MYSQCPQCGHPISWLERWKLSTQKPYSCPSCKARLLKNKMSQLYFDRANITLLLPLVALGLLSWLTRAFHATIPDVIEIPICLFILIPPIVIGYRLFIKGLQYAEFVIVENEDEHTGHAES